MLQITATLATILAQPAPKAGIADGTLRINGMPIKLTHAFAHLHENVEGQLMGKRELRILLTDREAPAGSLRGLAFTPIWQMAMRGKVQGVLLKLDPATPNTVNAVVLLKPTQPGRSLMSSAISVSGGMLFKDWQFGGDRVSGSIDWGKDRSSDNEDIPNVAYTARFDALVTQEPAVTQDLKGAAAAASAPVKALLLAADAMARADFPALKKFSSARAGMRVDEMLATSSAKAKATAKQSGAEMKTLLTKVKRVIIRGDYATVLMADGFAAAAVREGGTWKSDD